jgi:hypothetical protein
LRIFVPAFAAVLALAAAPSPGSAAETRCGWLHNPTPGNWWLIDAQSEWTIMTQGGREPAGMDAMPDISARDYVKTNGNYGYACACLVGAFSAADRRVTAIETVRQSTIAACRKDRALPKP